MLSLHFERDPDRLQREWSRAEPALVFPLQSTVLTLRAQQFEKRLDRAEFVLVPTRTAYALEVHSAVAPTLTLGVSSAARDVAKKEYAPHFELEVWNQIVSAPRAFARTKWVDELANRYLFERQVAERHDSAAARFLETELTKELFFLGREALQATGRASGLEEPPETLRVAVQWIETHLFEPFALGQLARACHASESTLLRMFRRELGVPPTAFVRNRRLDEALLLLESRKYSASEVAVRVGYANLSAFTTAFTRRFGTPPSRVQPRRAGVPVLPPQGGARAVPSVKPK